MSSGVQEMDVPIMHDFTVHGTTPIYRTVSHPTDHPPTHSYVRLAPNEDDDFLRYIDNFQSQTQALLTDVTAGP